MQISSIPFSEWSTHLTIIIHKCLIIRLLTVYLFITKLKSISPYSSLSMHIDLMTSLQALNQGTVLKMLTKINTIEQ